MNDVKYKKQRGGLNRTKPSLDGTIGFITNGRSLADTTMVQVGTVYTLNGVRAAEALGINADYDADIANAGANPITVYADIKEHFRKSPGSTMYLLLVAQAVTMTQMVDKANANYAKKLLIAAGGKIRELAVGRNPLANYNTVMSMGLDIDVTTAIAKAQQLCDQEFELHRPINIYIEGRAWSGNASTSLDIRAQHAPNVSVVIGTDLRINTANAAYAKKACIGTLIGVVSSAKVNESIAFVEKFDLQSVADGTFIMPGFSGGQTLESISEEDYDTLDAKGYIFLRKFVDYDGIFFNEEHTAVEVDDDYAYISSNRTLNKGVRLSRLAILPNLNGPLKVDGDTGKLPAGICKYFEELAYNSMYVMIQNDECSAIAAFIDPDQDVLGTGDLELQIEVVPTGTARRIIIKIGFKNPSR